MVLIVRRARISINPFAEFCGECEAALKDALSRQHPVISVPFIMLETPPSPEFGELSSSMCFELAKQTGGRPREIAERIVEAIDVSRFPLIQSVKPAGEGYINFYVDFAELSTLTIESVRSLDAEYGYVKVDKPRRVIVEHTSVNPIHPIHIGQARNPVLGDALARILRARGHMVFRHYYVDDVGRQSAVISYGYEKLGRPKPTEKPDHLIGLIYTITSCIMEVRRLKQEIERAREHFANEEVLKLQRELDDWMSVAVELEGRFPQLFGQLLDGINKDEDPESRVTNLIRGYEAGEEEAGRWVREVCQLCIEGFKETLGRAGIFFDSWDWESDFVWNSDVSRVLNQLKMTPYVFQVGGVLEFNAEKVAQDLNLKGMLGLGEDYEIPSLTLVRADGTTLYTTRDIPYSLWKFQRAERVIHVIGMEQTLSQLQLRLALCALGHVDHAKNLTHFAYNLVSLPGYRMSSRRGRYITLDEVMEEAIKRAHDEVTKRSPHLPDEEKRRISNLVGIGAVKYALVEVDPTKPVVFTWDRVLNFEKNSAPFINYAYTRACGILRRMKVLPEVVDYRLLDHPLERGLVIQIAKFPEVFIDTADNLKPESIANYANTLAEKFHEYYEKASVIHAETLERRVARAALVKAIQVVLRNAMTLLGIELSQRM